MQDRLKRAVKYVYQRYLIEAMSGMALGVFSSLVIGLILGQIARIPGLSFLGMFSEVLASTSPVIGAITGIAIANGMKVTGLTMLSSGATGALGYVLAGPVGCYCAALAGAEVGRLVAGKTKVDIVLVPLVTLIVGGIAGSLLAPGINAGIAALTRFIDTATLLSRVPMGIAVSAMVGLVLTAPLSSAALCFSIFTVEGAMPEGLALAAGAATAGCCAHMIGFAVASYRENGVGGLISQGIGTSMLQISNILKKPIILLPAVAASVVTGALSTTLFDMRNAGAAAGMGTSGLVGQLGTFAAMSADDPLSVIVRIVLLHFIIPAAVALITSEVMRKVGWMRSGDMKLEL